MRLTLGMCSLLALVSCKQAENKPAPSNTPQPVENTPAPAVKREVAKTPLPALAPDTGGAGNEVDGAGYFDGECDFGAPGGKKASAGGSDGFLAKLTADGKMAWVQQYGAKRDDDAKAVAAHGDRVVVVGNFLDEIKAGEYAHKAVGSDDLFAAAYDKTGAVQWLWTLGGIDSDGANTVAASPDGGWVIGGSYSDSITIGSTVLKSKGKTDALLIKLAPSGDLQWI